MIWKRTSVTIKKLREDAPPEAMVDHLITESEYMGYDL